MFLVLRNLYHRYLPAESNSENSAPVANDFSVPITSDQPIRINLLEHTTDVDGDQLVASVVTPAKFSQMPIILENDSATVYYQRLIDLDIQRHQEDSFTYQVSDGKNTSNVATIRLIPSTMLLDELPPPNRSEVIPSEAPQSQTVQTDFAPVAHDVSGETQPGKPIEIMLDVTDEDSKDLTAIIVKEPDCGSEVLNQNVGRTWYTQPNLLQLFRTLNVSVISPMAGKTPLPIRSLMASTIAM